VAAALVVMTPSAAAASHGRAPEPATNATVGSLVTLTVSIAGSGGGWITSNPAGISCGSICSAEFPDGTEVFLAETPVIGSTFGSWSTTPPYTCFQYDIKDPGTCLIDLADTVGTAASVQATFNLNPGLPPCIVPGVEGKTLAKAEALIRRAHCSVGRVRHVFSLKVQKGRVISQNPGARWQQAQRAKVKLVVGKGRR